MSANTFTQWASDGAQLQHGPQPVFRNSKDHLLSGYKTAVESAYPDGYLGTFRDRRDDKILGAVSRNNARSYTRGVHKGERINPNDYFWPPELDKLAGLMTQEMGVRWTPPGQEPVRLVNEGKVPVSRGIDRVRPVAPAMEDPVRRAKLKELAPRWT